MPCKILLAQDKGRNELSCKDRVRSASVVRRVLHDIFPPTYSTCQRAASRNYVQVHIYIPYVENRSRPEEVDVSQDYHPSRRPSYISNAARSIRSHTHQLVSVAQSSSM